jgi:HEAT repeat protein
LQSPGIGGKCRRSPSGRDELGEGKSTTAAMLWWTRRKLQSTDSRSRAEGIGELVRSARIDRDTIALLIGALDDGDAAVRAAGLDATQVLTGRQTDEARANAWSGEVFLTSELLQVVLDMVDADAETPIRRQARETLERITGAYWVLSQNAAALRDQVLVEVAPLVDALDSDSSETARFAADTLDRLGWKPVSAAQRVQLALARERWSEVAALDFNTFMRHYERGAPALRRTLLQALGGTRDARGLELMTRAADDADAEVRVGTAYAIGTSEHPQAIELLARLCADSSPQVRDTAIAAFGHEPTRNNALALAALIDILHTSLSDPDARTRLPNADSLVWRVGQYKDPSALPVLLSAQADANPQTRKAAETALREIDDPRAREAVAGARRIRLLDAELTAILLLFDRDFSPRETFIASILDKMEARGRTYRKWMTSDTPVLVRIHPRAQDPTAFLATAAIELRRELDLDVDLDKLEYATFEGSGGISGVVVTLWRSYGP